MDTQTEHEAGPDAQEKAQRVQRILYWVMGGMMLLPFVVIWITGAIRFE
ncbi:hypothetical protein [Coraliomargarita akajimensis]|uniref:Uncharacterized protein n=1 Tax=Coraliomargarita akajimensis (strain DSM 45221 / IAM 15411 / JCM 23193 / KCTC 12865 / 04OKA010-24) TaxID=583355 RepID=D5EMR6_CORAD|nr:hypothetical protein [Coraliomargarita akajimensis]ADE55306.1 hypothetical protein Caka_2289 [Coraliomargarita akajimensis DSM 45221]